VNRILSLALASLCLLGWALLASCGEKKPGEPDSDAHFTSVPSSRTGIKFSNILSSSEYFNINAHPGFYDGAGVAVGDINNDGLPDLYFVSNQWDNKLYLNKGDFEFEDITTKAGVTGAGNWKTQVLIKDADNDGRPDIYVRGVKGNRYINTEDQLFLNNGDLTFTKSFELFGFDTLNLHLGEARADINNDGLEDIFRAGAFPFDQEVLKTTALQPANSLLINQGNNLYTDIAWYAGVAATDKSWTPIIADFDNDGRKDLFITAGIVGRTNDLKYLQDTSKRKRSEVEPPAGPAPNFIFRQVDELKFEDVTKQWLGNTPGFSNGAAYADLDNDGDIDIVVNNINAEASLLRNDLVDEPTEQKKITVSRPTALLQPVKAIAFKHNENAFNTLTRQPLIPFTNSNRGPKIAVADINGDKLDDLFVTGGQGQPGAIYIQTKAGKFVQIPQPGFETDKQCEETCAAFFDADGDKDLDLLVGSGGEEFLDKRQLLRLYINNGRGVFAKRQDGLNRADIVSSLQKIYVNASVLVPSDVDNDGDIDVFVGGGTVTGRYGTDSDSFILLNNGKGMLTESAVSFENRQRPGGMVQGAVWTDLDGDQFPELVTAGEWMNITVWRNDSTVLKKVTGNGLDSTSGWWHSLAADDLDGDGDTDLVAGNFGLNSRAQASGKQPLKLPASKNHMERQITTLESSWFENNGKGHFTQHPLPGPAQYFPVLGINITDVDSDGKKDIMLVGNLSQVQPALGRPDSGYGLILLGGKIAAPLNVKGEGRDVKTLLNANKEKLFIVARNNDSLVVFKKK